MTDTVAAVDCGTNSTRLLVAAAGDGVGGAGARGALRIVAADQVVTRLGQAVDRTGRLADEAIARTVDVIGRYRDAWEEHGAARVRVVATSAVRDAGNRDRFVAAVAERVGQPLDVLSGDEEAALAFAGAVGAADPERPALVLDIGGGSTELIVGHDRPAAATSRQLGCVRLTERALPGDPPDADAIRAAEQLIDAELDAAETVVAPHAPVSLVAVAGTATTLAALYLGLDDYDPDEVHGLVLPADDLARLTDGLRTMTAAQIAASGPVQPGREDVLLAGALILHRTVERFGMPAVTVSEGDILDGLCLAQLAR